ncbi:uncharacterized protein LOC108004018 isoform X1 [Apis cerana]|uniref:uncharacterized protein LOC108004018 isoform X1 n=1 Tax=Apis cerana TaxID=7461 RepID=UPI002B228F8F|nr:uncharacterized protein LOC108004018 isoform X1 [Apis cerana]
MTAILISRECIFPPLSFFLFPSIFKQFLDAAFALFSRIASVTFAGGHDLTSVKIMSSMQQWRCAVLGILRLKRFAFSPLPRNLHRRPNVQHEPNVERASCISLWHLLLIRNLLVLTPSVILGRRKGHVFGTWKGPEVRGPTVRRQHSLEDPRFWLGSVVAGILGPRRAPELRKGSVDRFNSENLRYSPSGGSTSANARRYLLRSVRIGSCSDAHDA